jgi:hypothetical protein
MLGSRCRHEFCWICSADYTFIFDEGNHRHEESCAHYRALPTDAEQAEENTIPVVESDDENYEIVLPSPPPTAVPTPARTVQSAFRPRTIPARIATTTNTTNTSGRQSRIVEERRIRREARRTARRAGRAARAAGNA